MCFNQILKFFSDIRRGASQNLCDVSFTSISLIGSQTVRNPFTAIALQHYDDEFGHLATKQWIQRVPTPAINESQQEQSSGISFSEDMSFGRNSVDMSFGQCSESGNEMDDNFETGSQKSFVSAHSFSLEDEHVKSFIAETEPNETCQDGLAAKQFSSPDKQRTEVIVSASTVKPLEQQIESKDTTKSISPSQSLNSFQRQLMQQQSFEKIFPVRTSRQITVEEEQPPMTVASLVPCKDTEKSPAKRTPAPASMPPNLNFSNIDQRHNETNADADIASSQLCPCPSTSTHEQVDEENGDNRQHSPIDPEPNDAELQMDTDGMVFEENGDNSQHSPIGPEPNDAELQIDTEGMVFDAEGCVFVNDDEVQDAFYVYIENNGLEFLNSESFKAVNPVRRKRFEREFRAIAKMISKVEDESASSNKSIMRTPRGTSKRKSWNGSTNKYQTMELCEKESGHLIQRNVSIASEGSLPFKKPKNSDKILDKSVDVAVHVPEPTNSPIGGDDQAKTDSGEKESRNVSIASERSLPFKKPKNSDNILDKSVDVARNVPEPTNSPIGGDDQVKSDSEKSASCTIMTLKTLIDYLKAFTETHETCEVHRLLLSQLIER